MVIFNSYVKLPEGTTKYTVYNCSPKDITKGFSRGDTPMAGWLMENHIKVDDLRVPPFQETSIYNIYIDK